MRSVFLGVPPPKSKYSYADLGLYGAVGEDDDDDDVDNFYDVADCEDDDDDDDEGSNQWMFSSATDDIQSKPDTDDFSAPPPDKHEGSVSLHQRFENRSWGF